MLDVAEILLFVARGNVVDNLPHRRLAAAVQTFIDDVKITPYQQFCDDAFTAGRRNRLDRIGVCRVGHRQHHLCLGFRHRNGV